MNNKGFATILYTLFFLTIAFCIVLGLYFIEMGSRTEKRVTIDRMWIKQYDSSSKYLFSDKEGMVYEICDMWTIGLYDASNRWASVEVNHTYDVVLYGWRIPFFSMYQNAVDFEEV